MKNEISRFEQARIARRLYTTSPSYRALTWALVVSGMGWVIGFPLTFFWVMWKAWSGEASTEIEPLALGHWALLWLGWISFVTGPSLRNWKQNARGRAENNSHRAEFLLWLFLPCEGREAAIGDTNEQFEIIAAKFGPRRARFWYWGEVARSMWPLFSYLGERLWKWTFLGSALEWLRRHI